MDRHHGRRCICISIFQGFGGFRSRSEFGVFGRNLGHLNRNAVDGDGFVDASRCGGIDFLEFARRQGQFTARADDFCRYDGDEFFIGRRFFEQIDVGNDFARSQIDIAHDLIDGARRLGAIGFDGIVENATIVGRFFRRIGQRANLYALRTRRRMKRFIRLIRI